MINRLYLNRKYNSNLVNQKNFDRIVRTLFNKKLIKFPNPYQMNIQSKSQHEIDVLPRYI